MAKQRRNEEIRSEYHQAPKVTHLEPVIEKLRNDYNDKSLDELRKEI